MGKPAGYRGDTMKEKTAIWAGVVVGMLGLAAGMARAAGGVQINIERPGEKEFVRDLAGMIAPADVDKIKKECTELLKAKATPIIVVTIESMAKYGPEGLRIETFARLLFDQWQIGHKELGGQGWNTGILLLVSRDDRKARIELGAGWGREKDQVCLEIMDKHIIPAFKRGEFSAGIAAGVAGLVQMAQSKPLPAVKRPWWHYGLIVGAIVLAVFTFASLIRRGSSGWAWLFWGAVFALVGWLLYQMLSRSSSGGGGGFGGGSFGGGSSGGGGASGSW